ncbi:MAG: acetate--CoA ligase family protein [Proteobacteria bacterium]|nr:acetate--CoA ligase family protein [Pseudomonadota bacterium]MBU1232879.1 acetate--CoA ligase family protein [Pseudomonadota bacterium]MBU1419314.1 acetate--CoA ligase family protein [Pseudomonadota bacterium]MBU1455145.1 acetate--CoA ligase family protein [Pseudomonadota bacterium]
MTIDILFHPKSVAVVGASRTAGKVGHDILANMIRDGYQGTIVPINPSADELLGLPCFPSLHEYGKEVELVVVAVPQPQVKDVVKECVKVKAKAVIVTSSGFREIGPEGFALEQELVEFCRRHDIRILGPNCLGLINTKNQLNASFAGAMPKSGGISIFSQSGALCTAMLDLAAERHLGLAKLISIGNKADISEVDILSYLAKDEETKVIVGYLEDISTGKNFVKAAEEASAQKPVIILKAGTTAAGLRAAASHTGVLAGADTAYGAAFKRSGVVRADNFEALFDYATALYMQPLPKGNNILIITNAGGPGTMAADAVERAGMRVAELDRNTASALRDQLPRVASVGNPIDVLGDADPERYVAAIEAAQSDPAVDAILVILTPQAMTRPAETAQAIANTIDGTKPVVASFMGGTDVMPGRKELAAAGLPDYESPERAVSALRGMREYAAWQQRPPRRVTRFRVNRRRVERILSRRQRIGLLQLGEVKGKDVLGAYGFRIPSGSLASSSEEAREIADRIGYPVAMKIVSPDIVHKSDLGGVHLNVANGEAAEDIYDLMTIKIGKKVPDAKIEGVYVEKMACKGLEVIIGMTRDPQFGPMLMFGLGGIFVEVMKDVTFHLAPITKQEAIQMLMSTKSYAMLEGRRGNKGVDIAAIASGLQRISQLTTDFPQILELDINPFIVGDFGSEPVVADVRMTLAPLPEEK